MPRLSQDRELGALETRPVARAVRDERGDAVGTGLQRTAVDPAGEHHSHLTRPDRGRDRSGVQVAPAGALGAVLARRADALAAHPAADLDALELERDLAGLRRDERDGRTDAGA